MLLSCFSSSSSGQQQLRRVAEIAIKSMLLSYYSARMHRENIKHISPKSLEEHCTWCNIQMNATLPFPKIQVKKCGLFHFLPHNKNMNLLLLHRIFPNRRASSKRGLSPLEFRRVGRERRAAIQMLPLLMKTFPVFLMVLLMPQPPLTFASPGKRIQKIRYKSKTKET